MRFSRHAKNRVRWLRRRFPAISEEEILRAIPSGRPRGADAAGNRRVAVRMGTVKMVIVVDDDRGIVITIWRED